MTQDRMRVAAHSPRIKIGLVQPNFAYTADGESRRDEALAPSDRPCRSNPAAWERAGPAEAAGRSEGSFPVAVPRDLSADFFSNLCLIRPQASAITQPFVAPNVRLGGARGCISTPHFAGNKRTARSGGPVTDRCGCSASANYVPGIDAFPPVGLRKLWPAGAGRLTAGRAAQADLLHGPDYKSGKLGR